LGAAVLAGFRGKCPACGAGKLFASGLSIADRCTTCDEALYHHRADDLPAYLNVFLVGHVVLGTMLVLSRWIDLEMWTLTALTVCLAVLAAIVLMRPLKGAVLGAQWAMLMHGFGERDT